MADTASLFSFPKYSAVFHPGLGRYAVIFAIHKDDVNPIHITVPALTIVEKKNNCECSVLRDSTLPSGLQGAQYFTTISGSNTKQVWAYTGEKLYWMPISSWIPIMCLNPGFPEGMTVWYRTPLAFPFKIEDEGAVETARRIQTYLQLRRSLPSPLEFENPTGPLPDPIPRFVGEALLATAKQKGDCCPISMCSFKDIRATSATPCYHLFESSSIEAWLEKKVSCPTCKKALGKKSLLRLDS